MGHLFSLIIYQPIYNIVFFIYNIIPGHDFGIAIIIVTLLIKVAMIPLSKKQIESQKKLQEMQPKIKEIQQKYKNDKEKQTKELMAFYKTNKANPLSGCLPLVVQLIFLIAIYRIIINISSGGLVADPKLLYSFVSDPGKINQFFIGIVDLSRPNLVLAILAAAAQFFQSKMLIKSQPTAVKSKSKDDKPDFASMMNKQMLYIGPILTLYIGLKFAAALALYWLFSTLFMILQQAYIMRRSGQDEKK